MVGRAGTGGEVAAGGGEGAWGGDGAAAGGGNVTTSVSVGIEPGGGRVLIAATPVGDVRI